MEKDSLHRISKNKMYDMPQTGKYSLLDDQALRNMWLYPCPNHSRTQECHIHSSG